MSTNAKPYKETLNLPSTQFDMKANLAAKEPLIQARWRAMDLYAQLRALRRGSPRRVLADGPPYANGEIHMGHLLNKVLKDIVVRSLSMRGFDSPYVPGWDCHGLPIETKVAKELGSKLSTMAPAEVRVRCRAEALKWVDIQRDQFRRLGIEGDWDKPYLTLDPSYEAGIMEVLARLVERGYVFRQLKPIHWDIHDRTALAEAELEYADITSPTVFVNFPVVGGLPTSWGLGPWNAMIWTTTPWTLPANVAIAVHPALDYVGLRYRGPDTESHQYTILAAALVPKVMQLAGVEDYEEVGRLRGSELENVRYRHVFIDRESPIVLADYVSDTDGTGLVHTAPGHGAEDYQTGRNYGLPTLSPVDASGRYNDEAPENLRGKGVFQANPEVVAMVREHGSLVHEMAITHSYPHGWRSKKPVIFRATEQWFIGADRNGLREQTLTAIEGVNWVPSWGKQRIDAMVQNRPDWCISRQRSWGVPIPVLFNERSGEYHLTAASVRHYRDLFAAEGADAWFSRPVDELLPPDLDTTRFPVESLRKGTDILDVWFESGASHRAVLMDPRHDLTFPAFMYLEGSDQHRGWFQSNILESVATTGVAPFENVLTHGFVVDQDGRKISKSDGNAVSAVKMTEQYGADVLRLFVAGLDYADDVRVSEPRIKEASEAYRKTRNTFRYLLGNLEDYRDFDPSTVDLGTLHEVDRWALGQLNAVVRDASAAYERFEFYKVYQRVYQFCAVELSSFYLDVLKDRLYAELPDGPDRRAAQYVMARLHDTLSRLLAPIVPHTAEELWDRMPASPSKPASIHLADWPTPDPAFDDSARDLEWAALLGVREKALAAIEVLRAAKLVGSSQAAVVVIGPDAGVEPSRLGLLATICNVSEVKIEAGGGEVSAHPSGHPKCERCWNLRASVGQDAEHPSLCDRCSGVVRALGDR